MKYTVQKIISTITVLFLLSNYSNAQRTITGRVIDGITGEALVGANVVTVGTANGTVVDLDGNFSLDLGNGATAIEVSYTGYITQTVDVSSGDNFIIRLFNSEQQNDNEPTIRDFQIQSAILDKFEPPIQLRFGPRTVNYDEALILRLLVEQSKLNALPPNIEPFLYIGNLYFQIYENNYLDENTIELVFHIRNWEQIRDASPMLLTVLHNSPISAPEQFLTGQEVIFRREIIKDER